MKSRPRVSHVGAPLRLRGGVRAVRLGVCQVGQRLPHRSGLGGIFAMPIHAVALALVCTAAGSIPYCLGTASYAAAQAEVS